MESSSDPFAKIVSRLLQQVDGVDMMQASLSLLIALYVIATSEQSSSRYLDVLSEELEHIMELINQHQEILRHESSPYPETIRVN